MSKQTEQVCRDARQTKGIVPGLALRDLAKVKQAAEQRGTQPGPRKNPTSERARVEACDDEVAALVFSCGDVQFEFAEATELRDPEAQQRIERVCQADGDIPSFQVDDLLAWEDVDRGTLFRLIAGAKDGYRVRLGHKVHTDLFKAVLEVMEGPDDIRRNQRGIEAAVLAAALLYPDSAMEVGKQISARLKQLGAAGQLPQAIAKRIKDVAKDNSDGPEQRVTPLALAERYLLHLQTVAGMSDDQRPLNYFESDFFRWNGTVWSRIKDGEFESEIARYLQQHEPGVEVTKGVLTNVWENLRGLCLVGGWGQVSLPLWVPSSGEPACPSPYLAFQNGLVDLSEALQTNEPATVHELDPQHFSPVILPYDYDPKADCPLWEKVLGEILPPTSKEDHRIEILQEAFGWCLLTGEHNVHLEKFFILQGNGSNGKSTVLTVLSDMLGEANVSHVGLDDFRGTFKLFQMADKLANISLDMNRPESVEEGILKTLVSEEPVQVERKYKDPLTMRPTAKLFFAANELPAFGDKSNGLWRRVIIIPFLAEFEGDKKILNMDDLLKEELPGILNWAIAGAKRLVAEQRFSHCAVCEQAADEHRVASDHFLGFLRECLAWTDDERFAYEGDLFAAYTKYCQEHLGAKPTGRCKFDRRLKEAICQRTKGLQATNSAAKPQRPYLPEAWQRRLCSDKK